MVSLGPMLNPNTKHLPLFQSISILLNKVGSPERERASPLSVSTSQLNGFAVDSVCPTWRSITVRPATGRLRGLLWYVAANTGRYTSVDSLRLVMYSAACRRVLC